MRALITLAATALCMLVAVPMAQAEDTAAGTNPAVNSEAGAKKIMVAKSYPSSKLVGLEVRNTQNENVGSVDDLVVSLEDGRVLYVALSHGGALGIGDKLFAVPYRELKFMHGRDEMYFVLDISKERLDAAPGFDKAHWPDTADPAWRRQIDSYYHSRAAAKTTERK